MSDTNLMKFFVAREGGTTSLLATAFDPQQFKDERQRAFRERFCEHLRKEHVDLSAADGPSRVEQEYGGMDLVMVWSGWILMIENKVAYASITPNQLNRYYKSTLKQMKHGTFLKDKDAATKRICVVFLTPTANMGIAEFASLDLKSKDGEREDKKVHLSWEAMLDDLRQAFPTDDANDPLGRLILHGCERADSILEKNRVLVPGTIYTEERNATKKFRDAVRSQINDLMQVERINKLTDYNTPDVDQLYGNIAGDDGNVDFTANAAGTNLLNKDQCILDGRMRFKVAAKAPRSIRDGFRSVPSQHWERLLGLDRGILERDDEKSRVSFEEVWEGKYDDLVVEIASLFCRFVVVFRPFMVNHRADVEAEESES
jgi:hypothetical protein